MSESEIQSPEPTEGETPTVEAEPVTTASTPTAPKQLVRSRDDRVIAGVCGGLGEYLGVDAVLIRIAALLLVFAGGAGIVLYVVGWIAMPEEPETVEGEPTQQEATAPAAERTRGAVLLGLVFIGLGIVFLVDEVWPDFLSWQYVWPVALIAIGIAVLLRARR